MLVLYTVKSPNKVKSPHYNRIFQALSIKLLKIKKWKTEHSQKIDHKETFHFPFMIFLQQKLVGEKMLKMNS